MSLVSALILSPTARRPLARRLAVGGVVFLAVAIVRELYVRYAV